MKTAEFAAFLNLYHAVLASPVLTVAEKTAAIEAAFDDYSSRAQPGSYHAIAKRLAGTPFKASAEPESKAVPPSPAPKARPGQNAVGARSGRGSSRLS